MGPGLRRDNVERALNAPLIITLTLTLTLPAAA
jgi:hypothetical protein